jgi:small-conductance mechanosensitive channel
LLGHAALAIFSANAPTTLVDNCGQDPGVACRLVWDVSHNGQAAALTKWLLAGPVHMVLQIGYVLILAFVIRAVLHRVINRITERATRSMLPQLRGSMVTSRVRSSLDARRERRNGTTHAGTPTHPVSPASISTVEAARVEEAEDSRPAVDNAAQETRSVTSHQEIASAAADAERALVDERRQQRVRALGSILRSAASVTVFSIAGVVLLGDLGINLAPLLASAGVVGIAVGFGAQNMVRDYLSGIFMLLEDQYGVGDVITIGDATGTVETVTLRITRMRDVNGIVWHVRNGAIEQVGNESQGWARAVIDFPVPYTADLTTIRAVLSDVAQRLWNEPVWRGVMLEQPEVWGAQQLTSTEVTMRIVVKTAPLRQWEVEREMRARVKAALDASEIPSGVKTE